MSREYKPDFDAYEKFERSVKEKFKELGLETSEALFNTFRSVLHERAIVKMGQNEWLRSYGIREDRRGAVDYFLEILPHLVDSIDLSWYFNDRENDKTKIKEFSEKYIFTPTHKVSSLYWEMQRRRLLDHDFTWNYFTKFEQIEGLNPYEKCDDFDAIRLFLNREEDNIGSCLRDYEDD